MINQYGVSSAIRGWSIEPHSTQNSKSILYSSISIKPFDQSVARDHIGRERPVGNFVEHLEGKISAPAFNVTVDKDVEGNKVRGNAVAAHGAVEGEGGGEAASADEGGEDKIEGRDGKGGWGLGGRCGKVGRQQRRRAFRRRGRSGGGLPGREMTCA